MAGDCKCEYHLQTSSAGWAVAPAGSGVHWELPVCSGLTQQAAK